VRGGEHLGLLANMGVSLLLFVVGLRLDLRLVRELGPVALATGLGQVAFTSGVGFVLCLALGLSLASAVYTAVALTFSSTIIIVKLLSDKHEIDSLHGRIAVGFLIVQDLVVVIVMIALSAVGGATAAETSAVRELFLVAARGVVFVGGFALLVRFALPHLLRPIARSAELLVLAGVALAIALAAFADHLGFSKEVGAFLAGVGLASTGFRDAIATRLAPLRDFLLLFFFVELGSSIDLGSLGLQIGPAVVLSLFVLVGNPLIVMIIMGVMGYRKRTGFLAGLTVAQISEFSLILVALGRSLGHVGDETVGLVTLVGLVTITASTYLILDSHRLYDVLAPWLSPFERRSAGDAEGADGAVSIDAVVFGLGRYGNRIARGLRERGFEVLGVDFDPEAVEQARTHGLHARYGDAEDPEFPSILPLETARWIVCAAPGTAVNLALAGALRDHGFRGRVALMARTSAEAERLESVAEILLLPFADAASRAVEILAGEAPESEPDATEPEPPADGPAASEGS
jgi:Kef-type K+ transport system membrane component KefB